ncbi:MAG: sigma-70 family RNA polymerase sigma factor [Planctomycetaceae bacterium]|jgi:RNA polymerase sigma-70 factor (ECF subfamily)|nr:sigma-70 family RNA polymerase sigma factor [Planctomycetaceae bacterium]
MATSTRATLLERLRDGANALAWEEFFGHYWPLVYGFARRRGCSEHTAEEIVQDVMLAVFQHRDVYQYDPGRGRFRDWLGTVVRNKVAEHRRKPANRLHGAGGDSERGAVEEPAGEEDADEAWEAIFEQGLLLALLDVVRRESSARAYLAFELVTFEGLSGKEAGRLTGLSRNAVYKASRRILDRLVDLGAPYREEGRLVDRIKQALEARPSAAVRRSVTTRVQQTMGGR